MKSRRVQAWTGALWVLLSLAAAPAGSSAQSTEAAATALFDEARKLMGEHRFAEACSKFAQSQRLAPSGGTLINLAECHERVGQTASAWVAWKNVAARANAAGKSDVEKRALERAAVLEPGLSRMVIAVAAGSDVSGLEVTCDGVTVGRAEFGLPVPVDPGAHLVEASAPGRRPFSLRVEVTPGQPESRVDITLAVDLPPTPPAPRAAPAPPIPEPASIEAQRPLSATERPASSRGAAQRTLGIITVGVGAAGVALGSVFGLVALSKNDEALRSENCRTSMLCSARGLSLTADAKDAAMVSTVAFAVGTAAVAGGATLWLTAPKSGPSGAVRVRLVPAAARSYGGVTLDGAW